MGNPTFNSRNPCRPKAASPPVLELQEKPFSLAQTLHCPRIQQTMIWLLARLPAQLLLLPWLLFVHLERQLARGFRHKRRFVSWSCRGKRRRHHRCLRRTRQLQWGAVFAAPRRKAINDRSFMPGGDGKTCCEELHFASRKRSQRGVSWSTGTSRQRFSAPPICSERSSGSGTQRI